MPLFQDSGEDSSLCDRNVTQQLIELIILTDGQEDMAGLDVLLPVDFGGMARHLQQLGRQILQDGGSVHSGRDIDPPMIASLFQIAIDSAHWKDDTCSGGLRDGLVGALLRFFALACLFIHFNIILTNRMPFNCRFGSIW